MHVKGSKRIWHLRKQFWETFVNMTLLQDKMTIHQIIVRKFTLGQKCTNLHAISTLIVRTKHVKDVSFDLSKEIVELTSSALFCHSLEHVHNVYNDIYQDLGTQKRDTTNASTSFACIFHKYSVLWVCVVRTFLEQNCFVQQIITDGSIVPKRQEQKIVYSNNYFLYVYDHLFLNDKLWRSMALLVYSWTENLTFHNGILRFALFWKTTSTTRTFHPSSWSFQFHLTNVHTTMNVNILSNLK